MGNMVYWDHSYNLIILLNLTIAIALFVSLRLFSGTISHINATRELLKKDNPAFGISMAGVTLAVSVLLSGVIFGDPGISMLQSGLAMASYGIVGIILMGVTRIVFDKIALPDISLRDEIVDKNIAVAIADTGNVLAAAVILRAIMIWIGGNTFEGLIVLVAAYAVSQMVMTAATFVRLRIFSAIHKGHSIQEELANGNVALALSFAGRKIGTAFAIGIASHLVVYEVYDVGKLLVPWLIISVIMILLIKVLSFITARIVLFKADIADEVLNQRNIAIGAMHGVIYISIALLLSAV